MRTRTKWIIGIVVVILLLIIIGNSGKKQQDLGLSDFDVDIPDVEQPAESTGSSDLDQLQAELDALQTKINALESEDLGGLSE